jgi:DNA repair exonuclease SbcCD ATPase subunit
MEMNPEKVKRQLYKCFLAGYKPRYDFESCVDHFCNWFVLSRSEFHEIKQKALEHRLKLKSKHKRQKRLDEERIAFCRTMKFLIPILVSVTLAFLGFIIVYIIIPLVIDQKDINYLQQEVESLKRTVETIHEKQIDMEKQNARWEEKSQKDLSYFQEEITGLKQRTETVQQKQNDIDKQIAEGKGDKTYLAKETARLIQQVQQIQQMLNDLVKPGEKSAIGY